MKHPDTYATEAAGADYRTLGDLFRAAMRDALAAAAATVSTREVPVMHNGKYQGRSHVSPDAPVLAKSVLDLAASWGPARDLPVRQTLDKGVADGNAMNLDPLLATDEVYRLGWVRGALQWYLLEQQAAPPVHEAFGDLMGLIDTHDHIKSRTKAAHP